MRLLDTLRQAKPVRDSSAFSFDDLLAMFAFNGDTYYGATLHR